MVTLPNDVRENVAEFIRQLNANNITILQAYVFGSYAQGRQTEWSDIDLALVSDQFEGDFFNDRSKIIPFVIKMNKYIEAHPFAPTDFTADDPFVEEIIETGIKIA